MLILSIDPRIIPVSVLKRLALKTGRESENRVGTTRRLVSFLRHGNKRDNSVCLERRVWKRRCLGKK